MRRPGGPSGYGRFLLLASVLAMLVSCAAAPQDPGETAYSEPEDERPNLEPPTTDAPSTDAPSASGPSEDERLGVEPPMESPPVEVPPVEIPPVDVPSVEERPSSGPPPREDYVPGRVIVKFGEGVTPERKAAVRSEEGLALLEDLGLPGAEVDRVEGRSVEEAVRDLERRPEVEYAEPDSIVYPSSMGPASES